MPRDQSLSDESKKSDNDEKKDLTGIFAMPGQGPHSESESGSDSNSLDLEPMIEQVQDFDSIESLGMIDHLSPEAENADLEPKKLPSESVHNTLDFSSQLDQMPKDDLGSTVEESVPSPLSALSENLTEAWLSVPEGDLASPELTYSARPSPYLDEIRQYSDRAQESSIESEASSPFHLRINGRFDPFSRDRLLLFITENKIGLSSQDLDLQLGASRVLFPRISEFAGIKLIQDLRDSGLSFELTPSARDADEILPIAPAASFSYEPNQSHDANRQAMSVLPDSAIDSTWQVFDSIQITQFLHSSEMEIEKSELFQELVERMLENLKAKAKRKGAQALTHLTQTVTPLRLPSQYQIHLSASLLKKS